ncbi:TNF receptor-associated factor 1-like [Hydra vulgaris]|uniref:TNF receptor-associated factor 1-like n=1 Tax=Hydra vulgaris TaxID=6087 RepID=UPI0032E9C718
MASNLQSCCFCEKDFTINDLLKHQVHCSALFIQEEERKTNKNFILINDNEMEEVFSECDCGGPHPHRKCALCNESFVTKSLFNEHYATCSTQKISKLEEDIKKIENYVDSKMKNFHSLQESMNYLNTAVNLTIKEGSKVDKKIENLETRMSILQIVYKQPDVLFSSYKDKLRSIVGSFKHELKQKKNECDQHYDVPTRKKLFICLDNMTLRLQSNEPYYSKPCFTEEGYCFRVKIFGYQKPETLAIYVQILKSEHDHMLTWPMKNHVYFFIKNNHHEMMLSFPTSRHIESFDRPVYEANITCGYDNFIKHDQLKNYIINDKLWIQVYFT